MIKVAQQTSQRSDIESSHLESVDDRMIGMMRLILAWSALLIIYVDPSEPDRFVALTYIALSLYVLYSTILYLLSIRTRSPLSQKIICWIDVASYLVLVALSSGTSSIFFYFFFFAILVASFRWGFNEGLRVTIVSASLFTVIGLLTARISPEFELNRFLLRPIYLLVLGYMMAYWGGLEVTFKRRLSLLKEVGRLSTPRFGFYPTIGSAMKKLRAFYDADSCRIILADPENDDSYRLLQVDREQTETSAQVEIIPSALARLLLVFPDEVAVVYSGKQLLWSSRNSDNYIYNIVKRARTEEGRELSGPLAARLDAESFVSVPLRFHNKVIGRFYITARRGLFEHSDVEFLIQVFEQVAPILDNIQLVDRLASSAAEQERQRLARDIHDSVIQPYLGLHYKLAAIRNKIALNSSGVAEDVERLFQMTASEVAGLRGFVRGLKDEEGHNEDFQSAVQRIASQFIEHYDIDVRVQYLNKINIDARLAAEIVQIIYEGLSNIRKHTQATHSTLNFNCDATTLHLEIENDGASIEEALPALFIPRSITERATSLGGKACVEHQDGHTKVKIEIPL
jgi:signal transduction histidine kinase